MTHKAFIDLLHHTMDEEEFSHLEEEHLDVAEEERAAIQRLYRRKKRRISAENRSLRARALAFKNSSPNEYEDFAQAIEDHERAFEDFSSDFKAYENAYHALEAQATALQSKMLALRSTQEAIKTQVRRGAANLGLLHPMARVRETQKAVESVKSDIIETGKPHTRRIPRLISLLMGPVPLKMTRSIDRMWYGEAFESFKIRMNLCYLACVVPPVFLDLSDGTRGLLMRIATVLLGYSYVSSTIRTGVLSANGAKIHLWWIVHHILTAGLAIAQLSLGFDAPIASNDRLIQYLGIYISVISLLLSQTQKRRIYLKASLGYTNNQLSVASNEVLLPRWDDHLSLVILVLFSHIFEMYTGAHIFHRWLAGVAGTDSMVLPCGGLVLAFLGLMNFSLTISKLGRNRAFKRRIVANRNEIEAIDLEEGEEEGEGEDVECEDEIEEGASASDFLTNSTHQIC